VTDPARPGEGARVGGLEPNGAVARDGVAVPDGPAPPALPRAHPYRQPATWWLRRRGYLLYVIRELTAVPVAIWMALFLVEVWRLRDGPAGYRPFTSPLFVAFSVLALVAALWHSVTFLNLAGLIMRIPLRDRSVPARAIVGGAFAAFAVATAVVAAALVWGGA
jgi:fumarate reductase subunit C